MNCALKRSSVFPLLKEFAKMSPRSLLLLTLALLSRSSAALEQVLRADAARPRIAQISSLASVDAKEHSVIGGTRRTLVAAASPAARQVLLNRKNRLIVGLALLAGWTDSICFKLFGYYPNLMTGHTIRLSTALAEKRWSDAFFFITLLIHYFFGFGLHRVAVIKQKRELPSVVAPAVLLLFIIADRGALYHTLPLSRWNIMPLALAYGLLNAVSLETAGMCSRLLGIGACQGHVAALQTLNLCAFAALPRN